MPNRALTAIAKALEHDDMARSGSTAPPRIARWSNRARRPLIEAAAALVPRAALEELLDENGWPGRRAPDPPRRRLRSSIPREHAAPPRAADPEMNAVIEERGRRSGRTSASPSCRTSSPTTRRALPVAHRLRHLVDVLAAVAPAFGYVPHLSTSLPRGIRLQESSNAHSIRRRSRRRATARTGTATTTPTRRST